jgi:hypothetical protein
MTAPKEESDMAATLVDCLREIDLAIEKLRSAGDRLPANPAGGDSESAYDHRQVAEVKQELDLRLRLAEKLVVGLLDSISRVDAPVSAWRNCYGFRLQDLPREL